MTSTLDTNVLVYASDQTSPYHKQASQLLGRWANGTELVYLFWPVAMGYLRIATHPSIFTDPLSPEEAMSNVDDLVSRPNVRVTGELDGFWEEYRRVTAHPVPRGNLVPDAHLVTLMHQHGVSTIWSHDRDLWKFDGINVENPFKDHRRRST